MIELTEDTVQEFIKEGTKVIKVWAEKCNPCVQYAPTVDAVLAELPNIEAAALQINLDQQVSPFRRKYMKVKGDIKDLRPAVFLFKDGDLVDALWGINSQDGLHNFLTKDRTLTPSVQQELNNPHEFAKVASVTDLKASMWELNEGIKNSQMVYEIFFNELQSRKGS